MPDSGTVPGTPKSGPVAECASGIGGSSAAEAADRAIPDDLLSRLVRMKAARTSPVA